MNLKEVSIFCFHVKLEYLDEYKSEKGDTFSATFKVLADNIHTAQQMLEEYLSKPEQTGFKFKACVWIEPEASQSLLVNIDDIIAQVDECNF